MFSQLNNESGRAGAAQEGEGHIRGIRDLPMDTSSAGHHGGCGT